MHFFEFGFNGVVVAADLYVVGYGIIIDGKCGSIWYREVVMSNSYKQALFSGGRK